MNSDNTCSALLSKYTQLQGALTEHSCGESGFHGQDDHGHSHGKQNHGHSHGKQNHGHSHGACENHKGTYSVGLHVGAIFVVLLASLLGTAIPLVGKYVPCLQANQFVFVLGKCMATGVVLSIAAIHLINHAAHAFGGDCVPDWWSSSYDAYAFLFAMIAAFLMHLLETELNAMFVGEGSSCHRYAHSLESGEEGKDVSADELGVGVKDNNSACGHHSHVVAPVSGGKVYRIVSALLMEFGTTLHSVFIGLTVGISGDGETKALLVALSFHQLFEGLALGSRLADASLRMTLDVLLGLIFSLSAPIGTAIGVGVVLGSKLSVVERTFVLLRAISDATCGGILLYLGFVLMLNDFPADLRRHAPACAPRRAIKRVAMYMALWAGAGVMAGIGVWL